MPGLGDFLPQPPWDGPPVPKFFKEKYYIQSLPPHGYLYHHSYYSGLKRIAQVWALEAGPGKLTISLTTEAGRYLSPLPFLSSVLGGTGVDGVVRIPYDDTMRRVAIPCLYGTKNRELVEQARARNYNVFTEGALPVEYRYIERFVTHNDMFVNENEYTVIGQHLGLGPGTEIFIDPRRLKRLQASLGGFPLRIRSLNELAEEIERGIR